MADADWSPPHGRLDAESARRRILAQHGRIREQLERARHLAKLAREGKEPSPDAVASAIGDIRTTMDVHLAFEEQVLLPILNDDLPLGPTRAERLREEHKQQRAMLADLHHEAISSPLLATLPDKLADLASTLLADMDEEERALLTPEAVRDDSIAIDQNSG